MRCGERRPDHKVGAECSYKEATEKGQMETVYERKKQREDGRRREVINKASWTGTNKKKKEMRDAEYKRGEIKVLQEKKKKRDES